jgi:hypothetical protein
MEDAILSGNHRMAEALRIKRQEAQLILNTVLLVDLD